jgi:predicted nucleic acid-binding protein
MRSPSARTFVQAKGQALRRLDMTLRAPDALTIMIAQRADAALLTFDAMMARSARTPGLDVVGG